MAAIKDATLNGTGHSHLLQFLQPVNQLEALLSVMYRAGT